MSNGLSFNLMCNEYGNTKISKRPVGAALVICSISDQSLFHAAPCVGVLSIESRAEILSSKRVSRAAQANKNLDVVQISNAIVPGYTTPVASHTCVVQDETDIPVAVDPSLRMVTVGPVSHGLRAGARKGETYRPATVPFSASDHGELLV